MLAVQLCPNDHPPFLDVCEGHARALALCGYRVRTIYFASVGGAASDGRAASMRRAESDRRGRPSGPDESSQVVAADGVAEALGVERPDLLVAHRYRGYRVGIRLARRLDIAAHVAIAHEFGFFARGRRRWRRRLLGDGKCRLAGVSDPVAEDLADAGVRAPLVLPNPLAADQLRSRLRSRTDARADLGLGAADFVIGVVGRLHPKKDPGRALRAFERFRQAHPFARLVFVGDGELRESLERGAGAGVMFAGFRSDGRELLKAFDVLLACATQREAFGLALLEAVAADVPVICADRPGPRFVLGDCATYFDTDDELLDALQNAAEGCLDDDRARRRTRLELFSVEALAARYRMALHIPGGTTALC